MGRGESSEQTPVAAAAAPGAHLRLTNWYSQPLGPIAVLLVVSGVAGVVDFSKYKAEENWHMSKRLISVE